MRDSEVFGGGFTRSMWTDPDHILLVYVGSAAEFALVEENDWLFYTGKLPAAPIDRFVSTFVWNRKVMLASREDLEELGQRIREFHDPVEVRRSEEEGWRRRISNGAFQAVGAMLIEYALRAEAYLEGREVGVEEREGYYQDQKMFFEAMGIEGFEERYEGFARWREEQLCSKLKCNEYTESLFEAYRRDLGAFRTFALVRFMAWFVPEAVRRELGLKKTRWGGLVYRLYPVVRCGWVTRLAYAVLVPKRVRRELREFV